MNDLMKTLEVISGAVDDAMAGRPVEDVIGEIGQAVDRAINLERARTTSADKYRLAWLSARRRATLAAFGYLNGPTGLCTSTAPTITTRDGHTTPPIRCVLPAGHLTPHAAKPNPNWDVDTWWTDV